MIAVDWGTSNFRTFRLDAEGTILARRSSPKGILRVDGGHFAETLRAEVGDWLEEGEKHILLCGMIGSREGWVEAKYLPCPVGIADLANSVTAVPFDGAEVRIISGVAGPDLDGVPEVMRGEETEAVGILDSCGGAGLVCFPGTHSKWIHLSDYKIVNFITCMTGELYGALRKYTILARTMTTDGAVDSTAFLQGVARSADSGGLLHHLFGVRTLTLMDQLKEEAAASYLSGLLIGHEVRAAMPRTGPVHLVGAAPLCSLYKQTIEACAGSAAIEDENAAARGLAAIGRRLAWI
ncbi:MAG: 2-dehydro-3-deoxygalactonokinase [Edaphobacter sp.]